MNNYNLQRFIDAQQDMYSIALSEIKNGKKESHWIWFIFPQLSGMGHSYTSKFYAIENHEEAVAYLKDNELSHHLREITKHLLSLEDLSAVQIMGYIDAKKLLSCMTLFDLVSPHDIFEKILIKYYNGNRCQYTLNKINNNK